MGHTANSTMHALGNTSISKVSWNNIFKRINLILNTVLPQDQLLFVPRHVETIKNIFSPSPCKKFSLQALKNWQKAFCNKNGNPPCRIIITLPQEVHTDIGNLEKLTCLKWDPFLVKTSNDSPFSFRKGQHWAKLLREYLLRVKSKHDFCKHLGTIYWWSMCCTWQVGCVMFVYLQDNEILGPPNTIQRIIRYF